MRVKLHSRYRSYHVYYLLKIIGLRYAVTLGITAGILNLVPYLGSFLAMIPACFGTDCWSCHAP